MAGLGAVVAAAYAAELWSIQGRPVTFLEVLASCLAGLFLASTISLILLGIVVLASRVFVPTLRLVNIDWDADVVGQYLAYGLGLILVPASTAAIADNLRHRLFPTSGVGNPPLFPRLTWPRFLRAAAIALIPAVVLIALWLMGAGSWIYIPLQVYILGIGITLYQGLEEPPTPTPRAVEAMRILLRAIGYITPDRVQTRQTQLDRLITVFDIVAYKEGKALAFHFEIGSKDAPPVGWIEAASLRSGSWAVFIAAARSHIPLVDVSCVMVLVGRRPDETLRSFAKQESIHIVEIEDEGLIEDVIAERYSEQELRELAQTVLGLRETAIGDKLTPAGSAQESG